MAHTFHSRTLSLRRRRGGGLCWFRQHKEGLKPFEGTKSVHRETSSNGKLPVKHNHSAIPMETTNQVQQGIKGYNVGGYFWNPGFCAQSEAKWIRAAISDSSYRHTVARVLLESYKVTMYLAWPNKDISRSSVWSAPKHLLRFCFLKSPEVWLFCTVTWSLGHMWTDLTAEGQVSL